MSVTMVINVCNVLNTDGCIGMNGKKESWYDKFCSPKFLDFTDTCERGLAFSVT